MVRTMRKKINFPDNLTTTSVAYSVLLVLAWPGRGKYPYDGQGAPGSTIKRIANCLGGFGCLLLRGEVY